MDWFEKSYSNVPLYQYGGPVFILCMNIIQVANSAKKKWNWPLDKVVTTIEYKKITTDHVIYLKVFYLETISYIRVSTDDVFNIINKKTEFTEIKRVSEEAFEIKFQ